MSTPIYPLISPKDLLNIYRQPNVLLVDASASPGARERYISRHLDGALFVDCNTQLADIKPNAAQGGRHPLPTVEQFASTLASLGISPQTHVVVYDDKSGANAASRLWWMLRSIGHGHVQVLDGGMQAAEGAGFPINGKQVEPKQTATYPAKAWQWPIADMQEVAHASTDEGWIIVDVRDPERYRGEKEPIDLVAGHIPGAINIPFSTNLEPTGSFLPQDGLKEKYEGAFSKVPSDRIIVHCGSGITACHTLLAVASAGMDIPKLYVGSWSEWSRNDKPMAKS